jgi:hypothetical protein
VGDVTYLHDLRQFPCGFPLQWLSTSQRPPLNKKVAQSELFGDVHVTSNFGADLQCFQQSSRLSTALYPFEWVATECPDHFGLYLSHLATLRGHIEYTQFLMAAFGAEFVLQEQKCALPISTAFTWGASRYMTDLNATQCAAATQQVALLERIEKEYPWALGSMESHTTLNALTAAAISIEDRTDVLEFFPKRNMPPLDTLRRVNTSPPSASWRRRHGGVGVHNQTLEESGVLRLLFAVAEMGDANVLRWFNEGIGGGGARQICDSHGATICITARVAATPGCSRSCCRRSRLRQTATLR